MNVQGLRPIPLEYFIRMPPGLSPSQMSVCLHRAMTFCSSPDVLPAGNE